MKSVVGPFVTAVALAVAGLALSVVGRNESRLAADHQQLETLRYADAIDSRSRTEQALGIERLAPIVTRAVEADARDVRAAAGYWRADYAAIAPQHDANGVVNETDVAILLLSANAAYRGSQATSDRGEAIRRLDSVIKSYRDVLESQAACTTEAHCSDTRAQDAAYDYEFAIRTRDAVARARTAAAPKNVARTPTNTVNDQDQDLPAGPTLHGRPGVPPLTPNLDQFNIVIPKRSEEREEKQNEAPDAGKGGRRVQREDTKMSNRDLTNAA